MFQYSLSQHGRNKDAVCERSTTWMPFRYVAA